MESRIVKMTTGTEHNFLSVHLSSVLSFVASQTCLLLILELYFIEHRSLIDASTSRSAPHLRRVVQTAATAAGICPVSAVSTRYRATPTRFRNPVRPQEVYSEKDETSVDHKDPVE